MNRLRRGGNSRSGARRRRVTAADVARLAGVSRSAVSRSYSKRAYVSREKRERILEAAEILGYRPNALAAGLNSRQSNLVAIVTGNLKNHYDSEIVGRLINRLIGLEKFPIVIGGTTDHVEDSEILELLDYPLDALVVRAGSVTAETAQACLKLQVPLIVSGRILEVGNVDSLCCDNVLGSRLAVGELLDSGRRNIGYLGGDPKFFSEQERALGFLTAMRERRVEPAFMTQSDFSFDGGYQAGMQILKGTALPDAVFCGNDAMALGLLTAARTAFQIRVPNELAIIGFDDIEMAQWPCFDLSTIRNPVDATVDEILLLLESRFADPERPGRTIRLVPELVPRGTH